MIAATSARPAAASSICFRTVRYQRHFIHDDESAANSWRSSRVQSDNDPVGTGSWRSPHGALPSESAAGLAVGRINRPHRDSCIWLSICKRFCEKARSVGRSGRRSWACHWFAATASNARLWSELFGDHPAAMEVITPDLLRVQRESPKCICCGLTAQAVDDVVHVCCLELAACWL
jgi:hypothetical protein